MDCTNNTWNLSFCYKKNTSNTIDIRKWKIILYSIVLKKEIVLTLKYKS